MHSADTIYYYDNYDRSIRCAMKEPRNSLATSEIEKEFADLRKLLEKIFCIPATSEPVERVFSTREFFMQPHCAVLAWATSY